MKIRVSEQVGAQPIYLTVICGDKRVTLRVTTMSSTFEPSEGASYEMTVEQWPFADVVADTPAAGMQPKEGEGDD